MSRIYEMRKLFITMMLLVALFPTASQAGPLAGAIAGLLVAVGVPAGVASVAGWGIVTPAVVSREQLK